MTAWRSVPSQSLSRGPAGRGGLDGSAVIDGEQAHRCRQAEQNAEQDVPVSMSQLPWLTARRLGRGRFSIRRAWPCAC